MKNGTRNIKKKSRFTVHAKSQQAYQLNQEIHYGVAKVPNQFSSDAKLQMLVRLLEFLRVLANLTYNMWGIMISIILGELYLNTLRFCYQKPCFSGVWTL